VNSIFVLFFHFYFNAFYGYVLGKTKIEVKRGENSGMKIGSYEDANLLRSKQPV